MDMLSEIDWAALATFIVGLIALRVPYISANIDKRRRAHAALQLSELALQAIDPLGGVEPSRQEEHFLRSVRELSLVAILEAMSRVPPDHLGTAAAVDAFIRLQGIGRSLIDVQKTFGETPSAENAALLIEERPGLRATAHEQVERLRMLLR